MKNILLKITLLISVIALAGVGFLLFKPNIQILGDSRTIEYDSTTDTYIVGDKTLAGYDATVCSSGCDYTSVETAIETESPSTTIYVARGTYSEANATTFQNGQRVVFDDVEIECGSDYCLNVTANDVTLEGRLELTGDVVTSLIYAAPTSNRIDASDCLITLNPTFASVSTTWGSGADIRGKYHKFKFLMHDQSFTSDNASYYYMAVKAQDIYYSQISVAVNNIDCTGATGLARLSGLEVSGTSLYNSFDVIAEDITTNTGNTGIGLQIATNVDYCGFTGAIRNNDGGNVVVSAGATGNNYTAVAD